jgi:hypothetical protein
MESTNEILRQRQDDKGIIAILREISVLPQDRKSITEKIGPDFHRYSGLVMYTPAIDRWELTEQGRMMIDSKPAYK